MRAPTMIGKEIAGIAMTVITTQQISIARPIDIT